MPPACENNGKRIVRGLKRVALTSTKAYFSFVGIGAAIKLAKNPGDLRPDALQFVRAAFTGTERADSLEVQKGRDIVLKTYGDFIDTKTQCVDPLVTFVPALRGANNRQHSGQFIDRSTSGIAGTALNHTGIFFNNTGIAFNHVGTATNSTQANNSTTVLPPAGGTPARSSELRFTTYNLYLPQIAVHEYLHCFTHANFSRAVNEARLDGNVQHALVEGSTQYLTLQTSFSRRGDRSGKYSGIYVEEVKFISKVVDKVGINTLKKAYFSGDQMAIAKVRDAAAERAEILFRG